MGTAAERLWTLLSENTWIFVLSILWSILMFVLGTILGEMTKDWYRALLARRASSRSVRAAQECRQLYARRHFSFGRIQTDVFTLDLAADGYDSDFFVATVRDASTAAPAQYATAYAEYLNMREQQVADYALFKGKTKLAARDVAIWRTPDTERKAIKVVFERSPGYAHQRAATDVYQSLSVAEREGICADPDATMIPFFSNSLGIIVTVITGDGECVFARRSQRVAVNAGKIVASAVEGVTTDDFFLGRFSPALAAERAVWEEFGIRLDAEDKQCLKFLSCIFNESFHEWNLTAVLDLRRGGAKFSSLAIGQHHATAKPHDKWEVAELIFIEFRPEAIASYIYAHEDDLTNYSIAATIYALLHAYPRRDVIRCFESVP